MRILLLLLLPLALSAGPNSADDLMGRWRSTDVLGTNVSAVFEFDKDNQVDSYSAAILEGRYRLLGTDTVVLRSKEGQELKMEIEWDSEDRGLIENETTGTSFKLERAGKIVDPKNPLVGEWNTTRDWNGRSYPARALFSADGRNVWIIKLRSERGRYSVHGQSIRIEIENRPVLEGNFVVTGDQLTLPNPKGGPSRFDRF